MKNIMRGIFFGRNSKLSLLIALGVFAIIGLGCFGGGRNKSAAPIPPAYLGDWQGQDGTTISIRADGTGDYHSGGTKVDGGTAEVNETDKTLSITFFGIGKTLKIDQAPSGDQMKLDGITFKRKGGFTDTSSTSSSNSTSNSTSTSSSPTPSTSNKSPFSTNDSSTSSNPQDNTSQGDLPSDTEVETLVKETMSDFTSGVTDGDFSVFRQRASKHFQSTYTNSQINTNFQVFIDKKDSLLPSLNTVDSTSASFSEPPRLTTENGYKMLVANGSFPTSPYGVYFETQYELEKGQWKILKFKIKMV